MMRRTIICLSVLALIVPLGCRKRRPGLPKGKANERSAETARPVEVAPEDGPIKVSTSQKVIVICDLKTKQTRLMFRPRAASIDLNGKRLAWSEGKKIFYCDLPDGKPKSIDVEVERTPVAVFGDRLVYRSKAGVRLHNLADGSKRDFKMRLGRYFHLDDNVLVQSYSSSARKIRYAKLDTGEIVNTDLRDTTGRGIGFNDGKIVAARVVSTGKRKWQRYLCVLDTVTGKMVQCPTSNYFAWMRFIGDRIIGYGGEDRTSKAFYWIDPTTGTQTKAFDCDRFSAQYGYQSNGRQLAWGHMSTTPPKEGDPPGRRSTVWLWDSTANELREISAEARARMPQIELVVTDRTRRLAGPDTKLRLSRDLGRGSVCLGDGWIAWMETWAPTWRVPVKEK